VELFYLKNQINHFAEDLIINQITIEIIDQITGFIIGLFFILMTLE